MFSAHRLIVLLFLLSFMKVSLRVEELLSEHDLTDRQMDIQTDIQTTKGKTVCLPQMRET